ncbi:imidazole glycerol phosphate synthase subunit HisH [Lactobacillus pentosus] [Lactiplantibacillus mudanjiangensis]|nr:imidazole glycerol phosphate synthase subunit HisH [Lactobacillus pentosus] [Lactiplantibacillus mudanjiangensis]
MFAIVDYDTGNTRNLKKAFDYLDVATVLTADPAELAAADAVILPGVGAFAAAMAALNERQLVPVVQRLARDGKPMLGICLGMQLLFKSSNEYGDHVGLGLLLSLIHISEPTRRRGISYAVFCLKKKNKKKKKKNNFM